VKELETKNVINKEKTFKTINEFKSIKISDIDVSVLVN